MQPQTPAQGERPEDDFRFGYRLLPRTLPDGSTKYEQIPLTLEDVLHPEPDDVIPVRPTHAIDCRYLVNVFRVRAAAELSSQGLVYVSDDHLVDWGVPGQRNTSPDVAVFVGLKEEVEGEAGTFDLKVSGGRCVLVVEVVSPDRRENDVIHKMREYFNARLPLYVIVDQEKEGGPRQVRGFRYRTTGWEQLANDELGLHLESLELYLGLKDGRVACYDVRTGREIGDYCRVVQELEEADRRRQEQDQALEQAILDGREQRQGREAAEKLAREQALAREAAEKEAYEQRQAREEAERQQRLQVKAREAAEKKVKEQTDAREAAEKLAREQKQACETAEERIRQLEAALRALQPPP
jgi:Uma2 family endonuclease